MCDWVCPQVDNEAIEDVFDIRSLPPPSKYTDSANPPYSYYTYYFWHNLRALNQLREAPRLTHQCICNAYLMHPPIILPSASSHHPPICNAYASSHLHPPICILPSSSHMHPPICMYACMRDHMIDYAP